MSHRPLPMTLTHSCALRSMLHMTCRNKRKIIWEHKQTNKKQQDNSDYFIKEDIE